jgi:hypothetical protein
MSNIYSFLPFVAFLSNAVLLGVGLHRGMSKRVHRDYVYFMACVTVWTFCDFINWNWSQMPHHFTMTIYRLQVPSYIFLAYFFMRFIYSMVGKSEDWFYKNFYVVPLTVSLVGIFTPYMVYSYTPVWWGLRHEPGLLFIPAAIICIFAPAQYALCILLNFKTAKDKNERSQRKLMIAGCCFVLYVGMYTDLVAPHFMGESSTIQAAGSTVAIMAYCMHRAISKYYMLPFSLGDLVYELFQSSEQGVLIVNSKEEVTDLNPVALRMFSLDRPGEYKSDSRRPLKELIPEVVESSFSKRVEIIRERNGQEIVLKLHINKHSRVAENESGWVIVATDVTKERLSRDRLEDELNVLREKERELDQQILAMSQEKDQHQLSSKAASKAQLLSQILSRLSLKLNKFGSNLENIDMCSLQNELSIFTHDHSEPQSVQRIELDNCFKTFFDALKNENKDYDFNMKLTGKDFSVRSSQKTWEELFSLIIAQWNDQAVQKKLSLQLSVEDLRDQKRVTFIAVYPNLEVRSKVLQESENEEFKSFDELLLEYQVLFLDGDLKVQQKNLYEKEIYFEICLPSAS